MHHGKRLTFPLGKITEAEAQAKLGQVELFLMRLSQRLAVIPPGMTIVEYLQFDGRPRAAEAPEVKAVKLSTLKEKYLEANKDALEQTTLDLTRTHFRHFERVIGASFHVNELKLDTLQKYVNRRSGANGKHGRKLSATTIQKELQTFRAAWHWASKNGLVAGAFPNDGIRYPRSTEKPPFMTRKEIERQIAAGGTVDLWHALYLTLPEISEFLAFIKENALQPFLYPCLTFVAYTGARRSEMLRARIADVDFEGKMVTIHEKKRVQGKNTTRRVPLTPVLEAVLNDWLTIHPGGPFLFCQEDMPRRGVDRQGKSGIQLNRGKAYDHFRRTVAKSKWEVVAGFHVLRHSFISALASRGVDQRLVEEFAGHMNKETSRRYAHLYPSTKREAITAVFG
jgi:integrase